MKKHKENWLEFEKRMGKKRGKGEKTNQLEENVPSDIMVQRMSSSPSGRLKKYEPLDTRDFVPFKYPSLTLENVKKSCELYYNKSEGTCDVLASDRGPSCSRIEQIKGKKFIYIRFLEVPELSDNPEKNNCSVTSQLPSCSQPFPKSISISTLLKAGQLVREPPYSRATLQLSCFNVEHTGWLTYKELCFDIQNKKFANGAFRDAFRARLCSGDSRSTLPKDWVLKCYSESAIDTINKDLDMSVDDHAKKQVQMHSVARVVAIEFAKKASSNFGQTFDYGPVYFTKFKDMTATLEHFYPGTFTKYINNDGTCRNFSAPDELQYKAECLVHFSYIFSKGKFMLLDIQGAGYKLYDPEIATTDLLCEGSHKEYYFCAGNLSSVAIEQFISIHKCNKFCAIMQLDPLPSAH